MAVHFIFILCENFSSSNATEREMFRMQPEVVLFLLLVFVCVCVCFHRTKDAERGAVKLCLIIT